MQLEISYNEMLPLNLMDFEVFFFFLNLDKPLGSTLPNLLERKPFS